MPRGAKLVLVTKQEIVVLPRLVLIAECVLVVFRIKYNEPKLNQHSGNIVKGVPWDRSRRIHNVNRVPRLNPHILPSYWTSNQ
jgi:hypothetical protein